MKIIKDFGISKAEKRIISIVNWKVFGNECKFLNMF